MVGRLEQTASAGEAMSDVLSFCDAHSFLIASVILGGGMTLLGVALVVGDVIKAVYRR